jgi:hypothetical protein
VPVTVAEQTTPLSVAICPPVAPGGGANSTLRKSAGLISVSPANTSWLPDQLAPRELPWESWDTTAVFFATVATGTTVAVAAWLVWTTTDLTTHRCRAFDGVN